LAGLRAAGCSFGAAKGGRMTDSRGWCLPGKPDVPVLAEACGARGRVLVLVMASFAEMPGDVSRICGIIAHDLAGHRTPMGAPTWKF